jgi:hypothetical protein
MFLSILNGQRNNSSCRGTYVLPPRTHAHPDGLCLDLPLLQFSLSELVHANIEFAVFNRRADAASYLSEYPFTVPAQGPDVRLPLTPPRPWTGTIHADILARQFSQPQSIGGDHSPNRQAPTQRRAIPHPLSTARGILAEVIQSQRAKIERRTSARIQQLHNAQRRANRDRIPSAPPIPVDDSRISSSVPAPAPAFSPSLPPPTPVTRTRPLTPTSPPPSTPTRCPCCSAFIQSSPD